MILIALAAAAAGPPPVVAAPPAPAPPARVVRLPKGSRVPVVLAHGVSARTAKVGDRVILRTLAPVAFKGVVAIPEGSMVEGAVARVDEARGGRPGAVVVEAESVTLEAGGRILLDGVLEREGQDYRRSLAGGDAMVGGSMVIPLGRRGAMPNLDAGTAFFARTAKDW